MPSNTIPSFGSLRDDPFVSRVLLPSGFPWDPGFQIRRTNTRDRVQNLYLTDFVAQSMMNPRPGYPTGTTDYYVDQLNGSDTINTGLSIAQAFKSPVTAYNKPDVRTIYLIGGIYNRNRAINTLGAIDKNINLIGIGPAVKIQGTFEQGTWIADSGGMYHMARSNCQRAWDATVMNSFGDATRMITASSSANCQATPNSWFTDNVNVWIHRQDGAIPTVANTYITMQSAGTGLQVGTGRNVYAQDIDFECCGNLQTGILYASSAVDDITQAPTVTCLNCTFRYSEQNGTGVVSGAATYLVNCTCSSSAQDGFNYHHNTTFASYRTVFVEINCISYNQGLFQDTENYNGTTSHDGCYGVRVGGTYHDTYGPVLIDVLGAQSWNMGCEAFNSRAVSGSNNYAASASSTGSVMGNTQMWLADCYLHDPSPLQTAAAFNVTAPSVMYFKNLRYFNCPNVKVGSGVNGINVLNYV